MSSSNLQEVISMDSTKLMKLREISGIKIIEITTDLSSYAASDLRKVLEDLLAEKVERVVVNLSQVSHINSTAVGALVGVAKRLRQNGGDLKICALADNLTRTFNLIGASSVVEIYESENSALAAF
jgi:anti-anti-sigma factor